MYTTTERFGNEYIIEPANTNEFTQGAGELFKIRTNRQDSVVMGLWEYQRIYRQPGLYEALLLDHLQSETHRRSIAALFETLKQQKYKKALRVMDVGAGVGLIGEEICNQGKLHVKSLWGFDIAKEAKEATLRDRPRVYDHYIASPSFDNHIDEFKGQKFNVVTAISCVGAGDIDVVQFEQLFGIVEPGGWIVFNIREHPTEDQIEIFKAASEWGHVHFRQSFFHRYRVDGEPIKFQTIISQRNV